MPQNSLKKSMPSIWNDADLMIRNQPGSIDNVFNGVSRIIVASHDQNGAFDGKIKYFKQAVIVTGDYMAQKS